MPNGGPHNPTGDSSTVTGTNNPPNLRFQLSTLYSELDETEREFRWTRVARGWIRLATRALVTLFFSCKVLRPHLRCARQLVAFANWRLVVAHIHKVELLKRITDLEYERDTDAERRMRGGVFSTMDDDPPI